ncbi:MAG: hypothetical protein ABSB79_11420 [Syntrophales bacterium]
MKIVSGEPHHCGGLSTNPNNASSASRIHSVVFRAARSLPSRMQAGCKVACKNARKERSVACSLQTTSKQEA